MRDGEHETVVAIPLVVGIVIVGVQPTTIVVAIGIEQVQITVRITQNTIFITASQILGKVEYNLIYIIPWYFAPSFLIF